MSKSKKQKQPDRDGNVPRQVRMPPVLDDWLQQQVFASAQGLTVADKIRELVAAAREAELRQQA